MDPLSITASATAILAICLQAVHLMQRTIETVKNSRKVLVKLLSQTERLRLMLEQLRCLTKQLGTRGGLLLSYNDSGPKVTINELKKLVHSIAEKTNFVTIQMLLNKNKVDSLVEKMKGHEDEVVKILVSIATSSAVRTESEIHQLYSQSQEQSKVLLLFQDYFIANSPNEPVEFKPTHSLQIWFGDTYREGFSREYLLLRDRLSDAAFVGDWRGAFTTLREAEERFAQCWVNAPRLSVNPAQTSGWTPIHQAAFMSAETTIIQDFLGMGASRTQRTNWTDSNEFTYKDLSAAEIAREHGYPHLFEILSPVIRHPIPAGALQSLQERFHAMIREDLASFRNQEHLRLPELVVLTEMEIPEMWFPLKSTDGRSRGYLYHLDRRSLVVKVIEVRNSHDSRLYRVYENETYEIVEGVVFNSRV